MSIIKEFKEFAVKGDAVDNDLVGEDWLKTVASVFIEHPQVSALWGRMTRYKLRLCGGAFPTRDKYILRKAVAFLLPNSITHRNKLGFNTPIGLWLKDSSMNEFKLFNQAVFKRKMNYAA
jgi:asparagine synthetase B (glutamine-hydrolysing)